MKNWVAVVAVSENGVIGRDSDLPWKQSSDLQRFKSITMGHCLVMGRKTFQSIGRPLPGRQTIVLSRSKYQSGHESVRVVHSVDQLEEVVEPGREVMIVGGAEIYAACWSNCSTLYLTRIMANVEGNVYFPAIDWSEWMCHSCEQLVAGPKDDWPMQFEVWKRKPA